MLKHNIIRRVGNGFNALFWLEPWIGNEPLKLQFPRLFSISTRQSATVFSCGKWDGFSWVWSLNWTRSFRPRDLEEWNRLRLILESAHLSSLEDDSFSWTPSKLGFFTVKSLSFELAKASSVDRSKIISWKKLWQGLIPPRVEIFTWMALLGKISSKVLLARRCIIPPDDVLCILCNEYHESADHLLLQCSFARNVWVWWLGLWNLSWAFPRSLGEAFEQWAFIGAPPFLKKVWRAIFLIIIWSIWKERNSRIFRNVVSSQAQIHDLILTRLSWWIKGWGSSFPYSCEEIIRNPLSLSWAEPRASSILLAPISEKFWSPPPKNFFKWNVDASVNGSQSMSAIGGALRNDRGHFMCMFSSPIPPIEINGAEVFAIYRAIQVSMSYEILRNGPLQIESDSANAVKWCNEDQGGPWNLRFQLNYIRNARREWLGLSIFHKGRSSNVVADALARQGLVRNAEFLAWI